LQEGIPEWPRLLVRALGCRIFLLGFVAVFRCLIGVTARYVRVVCGGLMIAGLATFGSFCVML
jgi:hypothetical protein